MQWYLEVLKKYVVFSGRARRKEFWMFTLVSVAISIVLGIIDSFIDVRIGPWGLLGFIYGLAVLLPGISVAVRRLHDTGRSGWWNLIAFTGIGGIVLIVWWATEGNAGENKHGADPKAAERAAGYAGGDAATPPQPA